MTFSSLSCVTDSVHTLLASHVIHLGRNQRDIATVGKLYFYPFVDCRAVPFHRNFDIHALRSIRSLVRILWELQFSMWAEVPPTPEPENANSRAGVCSSAVPSRDVYRAEKVLLQQAWLSLLLLFKMARHHEPGVGLKSTNCSMTVIIL